MDINMGAGGESGTGQAEKGFAKIEVLLAATGGLSLSQVCVVTGLEPSTIQNWVKRGWVAHPVGKRYEEIHIARILIINALKDCLKLEHIAKLMVYLNGRAKDGSQAIIRESVLYNYLCEIMKRSGQKGDSSRGGIESVVDDVISDYDSPNTSDRIKLRKALTLMMFACVCTDVKRRTEAMMKQIINELNHPDNIAPQLKPVDIPPITPIDVQITAPAKPAASKSPKAARPAAPAVPQPAAVASPITTAPAEPDITPITLTPPAAVAPVSAPVIPVAPIAPAAVAAPVAPAVAAAEPDISQITMPIPEAITPAAPTAHRGASAPQPVTPIRITLDDPVDDEPTPHEITQTRKTISQALREWDISSVEKIIIDHDAEAGSNGQEEEKKEEPPKPVNRPWYIRKNK